MSPLFRRKPDKALYQQALDFVQELKDELSTSGIHVLELPHKRSGFTFQFADASPPPKPEDARRVQVVSLRKSIKKPIQDMLNTELKKSADNGMIAWDDELFRKGYIGICQDADGFTAISLPYSKRGNLQHRGDIATALNELEVAIHGGLHELQTAPPGRKQ